MADNIYQVRLQGQSDLPEDVYENVLFYNTNGINDTAQSTCEALRDLYVNLPFLGGVKSVEVRAYPINGGQPVASAGPTARPVIAVQTPHETAICLSYSAEDDPDKAGRRRRGRIFLGPLGGGLVGGERPGPSLRDAVLDFGESLASVGFADSTTWLLFSRLDNSGFKIESIWVDDAWDTQRRRGLKPTLREVRDVQ